MARRSQRRLAAAVAGVTGAALLSAWKGTAEAAPPRPHGEAQIRATFGGACNAAANDHVQSWPYGAWNGGGGPSTLAGHSAIGPQWDSARWWTHHGHGGDQKLNYGIGGYNCRMKSGNSSQYSVHAWGLAVDTNTLCNPVGQTYWNGRGYYHGGCGGTDYGNALPDVWKANNEFSYVNFAWGLSWNDPHHFQYATGY
ncbi:MAG TPA: M15 family metallopeptidase [Pseudonocardiaceae bacterium]